MPWSSVAGDEDRSPTVDPSLFRGADDQYPGGWRSFPREWRSCEGDVLAGELRTVVRFAFEALPDR